MGLIGASVGEYRVLREIARGSVSHVYLLSDGRELRTLKLFKARHEARAEREYSVGHGLKHPHINPIDEAVELLERPGVLMHYVPGLRLTDWMPRVRRERFLRCFLGVLEALDYLHARGIIHQDVKPDNILVDRLDQAYLIDFDLAERRRDPKRRVAVAGTIAYLSPEQAMGEPSSQASDLYAAGVILFQGLSGQVPFSGSAEEVLEAHRSARPPLLSELQAELKPYDLLLLEMLDKRPERRPSAAQALTSLQRILEGKSGALAP